MVVNATRRRRRRRSSSAKIRSRFTGAVPGTGRVSRGQWVWRSPIKPIRAALRLSLHHMQTDTHTRRHRRRRRCGPPVGRTRGTSPWCPPALIGLAATERGGSVPTRPAKHHGSGSPLRLHPLSPGPHNAHALPPYTLLDPPRGTDATCKRTHIRADTYNTYDIRNRRIHMAHVRTRTHKQNTHRHNTGTHRGGTHAHARTDTHAHNTHVTHTHARPCTTAHAIHRDARTYTRVRPFPHNSAVLVVV